MLHYSQITKMIIVKKNAEKLTRRYKLSSSNTRTPQMLRLKNKQQRRTLFASLERKVWMRKTCTNYK